MDSVIGTVGGKMFNQKDITRMMDRINSYKWKKLNDRSPYETFSFHYGEEALKMDNSYGYQTLNFLVIMLIILERLIKEVLLWLILRLRKNKVKTCQKSEALILSRKNW